MKKLLLILLVVSVGSFVTLDVAEAHRSGCHRWHSCPSDTGSYVCGDLGYRCKYPTFPKSGGVITPNDEAAKIKGQKVEKKSKNISPKKNKASVPKKSKTNKNTKSQNKN